MKIGKNTKPIDWNKGISSIWIRKW